MLTKLSELSVIHRPYDGAVDLADSRNAQSTAVLDIHDSAVSQSRYHLFIRVREQVFIESTVICVF